MFTLNVGITKTERDAFVVLFACQNSICSPGYGLCLNTVADSDTDTVPKILIFV